MELLSIPYSHFDSFILTKIKQKENIFLPAARLPHGRSNEFSDKKKFILTNKPSFSLTWRMELLRKIEKLIERTISMAPRDSEMKVESHHTLLTSIVYRK